MLLVVTEVCSERLDRRVIRSDCGICRETFEVEEDVDGWVDESESVVRENEGKRKKVKECGKLLFIKNHTRHGVILVSMYSGVAGAKSERRVK